MLLGLDEPLEGGLLDPQDHVPEHLDEVVVGVVGKPQGRAAAPLQGAGEDRVQAVQDHRGGLAQPGEVGRVPAGGRGHDPEHQHQLRALDHRRGERQAVRPHPRAEHHRRGAREGPRREERQGEEEGQKEKKKAKDED